AFGQLAEAPGLAQAAFTEVEPWLMVVSRRGGAAMTRTFSLTLSLLLVVSGAVLPLVAGSAWAAPCTGPGAPTTTQTRCLTAIQIPGVPLRSFDISWVNPEREEYYLADRSNAGIDIIDTEHNTFKRR